MTALSERRENRNRAMVLDGYLGWLREAAGLVLHALRETWESAGETGSAEQQAVAAIGLRLAPLAGASPSPGSVSPPDPAPSPGGLFAPLGLTVEDETLIAAAWWSVADPQLAVAFGCIHDDSGRRWPTLGALRLMMQAYGVRIPLALPADSGPVALGLLVPAPDADTPLRLTATAALLLDGWQPAPEPVVVLPGRLAPAAVQIAETLGESDRFVLRCMDPEDGRAVARAVAAHLRRAVEFASDRPERESVLLHRLGLVLPVGDTEVEPVVLRLAEPGAPVAPGWPVLDLPSIDPPSLARAWRRSLHEHHLDPGAAGPLSARMRLSENVIETLTRTAAGSAQAQGRDLTVADLHQAVRRHPQHRLDGMATLVTPSVTLDDLILDRGTREGLADVLAHARHFNQFAPPAGSRGRAVAVLLHGPSGTGKTAAAEAIAAELERDLWIADLAQVVSKWLGETSRNLDRLLTEAARAGAILLFDEAEGLFGRRAEVTDARDRYANLEIDHLLQRIELHEGLVILTSNRPAAVDEGFQRRLRLTVRFDPPAFEARVALWNRFLPSGLMAAGEQADTAAAADLSPAAIRAAALSALVFATEQASTEEAGTGQQIGTLGRITEHHIHRAVAREFEKSGRTWAPARKATP